MKKLLGILVLGLLWCNVGYAETIDKRVLGYADDNQYGKWFIFETKPGDVFTLSFAGSGTNAGIWIVEGSNLETGNTLCLLKKDDASQKLQNVVKSFMAEYGLGGKVKVDINNNLKKTLGVPMVKGIDDYISDTILFYFLKAAQSSRSTEDFLKRINCK